MADRNECDVYAEEVARRFDEFVQWARENWPVPASPLLDSDFNESRRELRAILGERLTQAQEIPPEPSAGGPQYVPLNPAPWP